jgi:peptidoglycan/LPS O-acetylase OafA/YrhL
VSVVTLDPPRLPTLDGWRTVAVLIVIWGHLMPGFYTSLEEYYPSSLSRYGGFGVDVFFGISGFLITHLLLDERSRFGRISLASFYTRRAFRILPPCFLYLGTALVTGAIRTPLELLSCLFFFRNYLPDAMGSNITIHLWSLAVEEHFYLLWPAFLVLVILRRDHRKSGMLVAWAAIAGGLWRVADAQNHFTAALFPTVPVHFRSDLRMDALLWGCFAAFLLANPPLKQRLRDGLRPWIFLVLLAAVVACIGLYSQLTSLWLAMLIPMLLVSTTLHPKWLVSRLLDHSWVRFVGRMSYSLYLWQMMFLLSGWESRSVLQRFPQNLVVTFVCAYLSYRFVEQPCMRFGRTLSDRIRSRQSLGDDRPLTAAVRC